MTRMDEKELSIIKKIATEIFPECKIILFGSRARNDSSPESDYDFLIITKDTIDIHEKRTLKSHLRKELAKYKIPADIILQSEKEVQVKKKITGHILKQIIKEGIAL